MRLTRCGGAACWLATLLLLAILSRSGASVVADDSFLASSSSSVDDGPAASAPNLGFGPESVVNWSGTIRVAPRRRLWYWFFESRSSPSSDPLLLWLTGGPGCSSLVALFLEQGPYRLHPRTLRLDLNPHSWNTRANVIWLDQPVGTGYSYVEDGGRPDRGPLTEREIANNVVEFLHEFLDAFPKYASALFFIAGESYAGHFVPATAARIVQDNAQLDRSEKKKHSSRHHDDDRNDNAATSSLRQRRINLTGVAIGNGLVDPLTQYASYAPFAYSRGVVSHEQYDVMLALLPGCLELIGRCSQNSTEGWQACLEAHVLCATSQLLPIAATGVNLYDLRKRCPVEFPLCYDVSHIERFLSQPSVQRAMGHPARHAHTTWQSCTPAVNLALALAGDWLLSFRQDLPAVLHAGVRVLVYAGEEDIICNADGNEAWSERMQWSGQRGYLASHTTNWTVAGEPAGTARTHKGLTFVRVKDAGHLVPMDQPKRALDLLDRFLADRPFDEHKPHSERHGHDDLAAAP